MVSTEAARETLRGQLAESEDWLYEDGITAPLLVGSTNILI